MVAFLMVHYKPGNFTETAMHLVITHIQEAMENRKLHLSFLDIEGTFDRTSSDITRDAKWHGLGDTL
jgi:predicted phosphoadenosine phosphosulfate sulfurtransferase